MIDFMKYDSVVVGCGLVGGIVSRYMAETLGKKVLILEQRNHIAGNLYDYEDENGILVHKYGPHVFHTFDKTIRDFVFQYSYWFEFKVTCMARIDNKFTPSPFNFQTIDDFYSKENARKLKNHISLKYGRAEKASIVEMLKADDPVIKEYADFLFTKDYSLYTAKQWEFHHLRLM